MIKRNNLKMYMYVFRAFRMPNKRCLPSAFSNSFHSILYIFTIPCSCRRMSILHSVVCNTQSLLASQLHPPSKPLTLSHECCVLVQSASYDSILKSQLTIANYNLLSISWWRGRTINYCITIIVIPVSIV